MTGKVKYNKPLRILAETNGMSLSSLEYRLSKGMTLKDALAQPMRSKEITKKNLEDHSHLTVVEVCRHLDISVRKLNRLSKIYDVYFRRTSHTQDNESKVIVWCALHSPVLRFKAMARFCTEQIGFKVSENQIRYRLPLFGFNLSQAKKDREKYQKLMLDVLWS